MGLKIKGNFTEAQITKVFANATRIYIDRVVKVYSKAGTAMVEDARSRTKDLGAHNGGSFGNITWDLRSSIGCAVFVDGVKKFDYFPILNTGNDGAQRGRDYAEELSTGLSGIVLIVVAGMEYARSVESKGYNVIDATAGIAEGILEQYINQAA